LGEEFFEVNPHGRGNHPKGLGEGAGHGH
jgi:hypothetical protein